MDRTKKGVIIIVENIYAKIIGVGAEALMDKSRDKLLLQDVEYQKDCTDLDELEKRYMLMEMSTESKRVLGDYVACLHSIHTKENNASYLAGIRDAILMLNYLGLLKSEIK